MLSATRPDQTRRTWPVAAVAAGIGLAIALVAATAVGLAVALHVGPWAEEPLPVFWPVPSFTLTDQQGRPFGSSDLSGRAALLSFVYTNCPDTCPLLTANMAQVQTRLRAQGLLGSKVQLVSITVDPRRDTPSVLAEYAGRYQADPDAWRFLSGEPEAIYGVLWGFKLNTVEVARAFDGADVVPHSSRFAVVDPSGQVRAQPAGEETSADEIVGLLKRALVKP
jgi:protein SCO1